MQLLYYQYMKINLFIYLFPNISYNLLPFFTSSDIYMVTYNIRQQITRDITPLTLLMKRLS